MNANLQLLLKAFALAICLRTVDAGENVTDSEGANVTDSEAVVTFQRDKFQRDVPMTHDTHHVTATDVFFKAVIVYAASSLGGVLICCIFMKCCGHLTSTASWEIVESGGGQKIFKRIHNHAGQIPSYTLLADEISLKAAHLEDQDEMMPAVHEGHGEEAMVTGDETRPRENTDAGMLQLDSVGNSRPTQSYLQSIGFSENWGRTLALVSGASRIGS